MIYNLASLSSKKCKLDDYVDIRILCKYNEKVMNSNNNYLLEERLDVNYERRNQKENNDCFWD